MYVAADENFCKSHVFLDITEGKICKELLKNCKLFNFCGNSVFLAVFCVFYPVNLSL